MAPARFSFLVFMSLFVGLFGRLAADEWGGLKLEGRLSFTEGPAWHSNGNLYFSDIVNAGGQLWSVPVETPGRLHWPKH